MNIHQFFSINDVGTDFFVGDLHGRYKLLMNTLEEIGFDRSRDRLFSVGDLVDRGNENIECLDLLKEPWFHAVRGNHEKMIIERMRGTEVSRYFAERLHASNGGRWFDRLRQPDKANILSIVEALPIAATVHTKQGDIGLVHAGWHKSWTMLQTSTSMLPEDMEVALWIRHGDPDLETNIDDIDLMISGHQNDEFPVKRGRRIWIDTLWRSKKLTVVTNDQLFHWLTMPDGSIDKVG